MRFFFFTASPDLAAYVQARGVDRVVVDLEVRGKFERQGHRNTLISGHTFADLTDVRKAIPNGELMARLNPVYEQTGQEIECAIDIGVDVLMLPMFRSASEVSRFCSLVAGRSKVCLLAETVGAVNSLRECVQVEGVDEVHVGLNDLHMEMGFRFMFEPLSSGVVDRIARILNEFRIPFGIGGIARCSEGLLPAELILGEHVRLGSTASILSRTFHRGAVNQAVIEEEMDFALELRKLRDSYYRQKMLSETELLVLHSSVQQRVLDIVTNMEMQSPLGDLVVRA